MAIRTARAEWTGDFKEGAGTIKPGSGSFEAGYSFGSIYGNASGTNPIEVLGASLAGCFAGGLAAVLTKNGFAPKRICTDAVVHINEAFTITRIDLNAQAEVPDIDEAEFLQYAELMKCKCPVAQALGTVEITLQAELI